MLLEKSAVPGSALVSDRRVFELLPIMVLVQPAGGPVLCGGMSRRRWVGLSGSIRNPIWWMAT